jgi:hypothetical protein
MRYELRIYKPESGTPKTEVHDSFESAKDQVMFLIEHAIERWGDADDAYYAMRSELEIVRKASAGTGFCVQVIVGKQEGRTYICSMGHPPNRYNELSKDTQARIDELINTIASGFSLADSIIATSSHVRNEDEEPQF